MAPPTTARASRRATGSLFAAGGVTLELQPDPIRRLELTSSNGFIFVET
jgi:hypothetical protein